MLLRGKPAEIVRQSLLTYALQSGRETRKQAFMVTFRGKGRRLLPTLLRQPRLTWKLFRLLAEKKACILRLPIDADGILVKNNIRVFYPATAGKRVTAKVVVPSEHRTGSLSNEILARKILAGQDFLVPVNRHDESNFTWLEEEFVKEDKSISETTKAHRFLGETAVQLYGARQDFQPVLSVLELMDTAAPELDAVFQEFGLDPKPLSGMMSMGFIHGDLSPANMLIDRAGRLWIIDWELAGFAPIAWDLKKLFEHDEAAVLAALEGIRRAGDLPASDQMMIALSCQYAALLRDHNKRLSYLRSNRNKKMQTALEMIAAQKAGLVSAIKRLDAMRPSHSGTDAP